MPSILITGFPGFLGVGLLPRILQRRPEARAVCLVQPAYMNIAERRTSELAAAHSSLTGRIDLVEGDITSPNLALRGRHQLPTDVDEIYHLAAIYDLGVGAARAWSVNVDGTCNVLEFAQRCASLRRVQYVSTCYVSGRHQGDFGEDDLRAGQSFRNHYEETKYHAEVAVRKAMDGGLPATIYRPAVVVGDSTTGATQKYDGPYFFLRLLMKQRGVAFLPVVGDLGRQRLNVVPRDFIVDAMTHLSGLAGSAGRCYALADPDPPTVQEVLDAFTRALGRRAVKVRLPLGLARWCTLHVPGVYRLTGVPAQAIDYFAHGARYDTTHATRDLAGSGITVPPFADYAETLVRFVESHPEVGSGAMA